MRTPPEPSHPSTPALPLPAVGLRQYIMTSYEDLFPPDSRYHEYKRRVSAGEPMYTAAEERSSFTSNYGARKYPPQRTRSGRWRVRLPGVRRRVYRTKALALASTHRLWS